MKLARIEDGWSIGLETQEEALALLAAQETPVGNRILSTTDLAVDRVTPGLRAIQLLRFAGIVLPSENEGFRNGETVVFPMPESQHLSGLMYGATRDARITGIPTTENDDLLLRMENQVEAFFGMD